MDLEQTRRDVHNKMLLYRALDRYVTSNDFAEMAVVWPHRVSLAVEKLNLTALRRLLRAYNGSKFGEATLGELRSWAANLGIDTQSKSRLALILEIRKSEEAGISRRTTAGKETAGCD